METTKTTTYKAFPIKRVNGAVLCRLVAKGAPTLVRFLSSKVLDAQNGKSEAAEYVVLSHAEVVRETEKAVLVELTVDTCAGRKGANTWVPKSLVRLTETGIEVKTWFISKLDKELRVKNVGRGFYGIVFSNVA